MINNLISQYKGVCMRYVLYVAITGHRKGRLIFAILLMLPVFIGSFIGFYTVFK